MTNPTPPRVGWHNTTMVAASYVPDPVFFGLLLTPAERAQLAAAFDAGRLAAIREQQPRRLFTGYFPAEQRRRARHGLYSMGIRKPPRRPTSDDRAKARAAAWGMAR